MKCVKATHTNSMQMKRSISLLFQCVHILCCGNLEESNFSLNSRYSNESKGFGLTTFIVGCTSVMLMWSSWLMLSVDASYMSGSWREMFPVIIMVQIIIQRTLFPSRSTSMHWFAGVLEYCQTTEITSLMYALSIYLLMVEKKSWALGLVASELQLSEGKIKNKCCWNNSSLSLARTWYYIYVSFDWFIKKIKYFCTMHTEKSFVFTTPSVCLCLCCCVCPAVTVHTPHCFVVIPFCAHPQHKCKAAE